MNSLLIIISIFILNNTEEVKKEETNPDTLSAVAYQAPQLTEADKQMLKEELVDTWDILESDIKPDKYLIYDQMGQLIMEQELRFDEKPSPALKDWLSKSEFLFSNNDMLIFKVL